MDAHSGGPAGENGPADRWTPTSRTGRHEPRPDHSGEQSPTPSHPQGTAAAREPGPVSLVLGTDGRGAAVPVGPARTPDVDEAEADRGRAEADEQVCAQ
ncbi:hypothetical protein OG909_09460 [Streptomyces sp. NBC_01754]|uniref:hypothetical protein n=1 Tax=Streptomyces sp. NBC_01754 TaxID=2975930 RepID=UPI002DDBAD11|nr:hypothetical protein [Streptomyces sp. NBC_01754]WSC92502.1 hypothetical protein OG909_09460 [Streptomyces sp. NBC_01754]